MKKEVNEMKSSEVIFLEKCTKEAADVQINMKKFWDARGREVIDKYSEQVKCFPIEKEEPKESKAILQGELEKCPILFMTANMVEANMMVRCLTEQTEDNNTLLTITDGGYKFHFSTIAGHRVAHVQPMDMASFTQHGSLSAIESVLKRYKPQLVVSVGVAFGADANKQQFGDVIVSNRLFPYDSSNKYSDKSIKFKGSPYETDSQLLCSWMNLLEYERFPGLESTDDKADRKTCRLGAGEFNWYTGTVLSGGSVIDEVEQKVKLLTAAENRGIDDVVGGEMEGSGIYFACNREKIPCIVIKGICDWGVNKNALDKILEDEPNRPDNNTLKDCIQALAFKNAFSAVRCLLKYDNTMISENHSIQDVANTLASNLFNMKSLQRGMMKIATINFLPYLFWGTVYSLISFFYEPILFRLFNDEISSERLVSIIWWSLVVIFVSLIMNGALVGYSVIERRFKIRSIVLEIFPIIIFFEVNVFLFFVISYNKIFTDISGAEIGNIIKYFQLIYDILLALSATVWILAKRLCARPENLKQVFADISFKNLSFTKCCCILENTSKAELYCMLIGWICKTQLSPVKVHEGGVLNSKNMLLITSQNCEKILEPIQASKMPKDFCSIVPDTLQVNYRMPNGDLVVHIITKTPRRIFNRESSEKNKFCTRYSERVLIYRDGIYEEVLKRTCYCQIIE